jgi:hypothetical protein
MLNAVQLSLLVQSPMVDLVGNYCAFVLLAGWDLQISTHRIGAIAITGRQLSTIFSSEKRPW